MAGTRDFPPEEPVNDFRGLHGMGIPGKFYTLFAEILRVYSKCWKTFS